MEILAIDSIAVTTSAAVLEDDQLLGEFFIHTSLTHSQTLMSMVQQALECVGIPVEKVDLSATATRPGSLTGAHIGVASVREMTIVGGRPRAGVSTLEVTAYNFALSRATTCTVMDTRCGQVYNVMLRLGRGGLEHLIPDRTILVEVLSEECKSYSPPLSPVGNGTKLCYSTNRSQGLSAVLLPESLLYRRVFGVGKAASGAWQ